MKNRYEPGNIQVSRMEKCIESGLCHFCLKKYAEWGIEWGPFPVYTNTLRACGECRDELARALGIVNYFLSPRAFYGNVVVSEAIKPCK